jgi:multicomponent K+:H+ antiporter subunit G
MTVATFPLWVTVPGTLLLICGGLLVLAGSLGLLRFPNFFARMHGPALNNTLGAGCMVLTSMLCSSAISGGPSLHELLIAFLVFGTAPIITIVLLQAALYRERARKRSSGT